MQASVTYWLDKSAATFPDKTAFVDDYKSISFKELQSQAKSIASGIFKKRIFKEPVVIYMEKSVEALVSFFGVAYSGNFYSPIDINMPANRIEKIMKTLNPKLAITTKKLKNILEDCDFHNEFLIFEEAVKIEIQEEKIEEVKLKGIDTDLLYVLFTSGSTGTPKGVTITHRSVIDYIDWVTERFEITEKDTFGNQAPFYFDNSVLDIYSTIKSGATTYIIPKELFLQPLLLLKYIKEKNINVIFWVPSALIAVSWKKAFSKIDVSDVLKKVLFAGEVMPNKQLNIWRKFLPDALYANLYGPTEITVDCTYYIVDRDFSDDEPLPIGIPINNTDILVLNDRNELVTGNEIGELCVRGTSLSMGYYNNPERTKEAFVQNPLNPFVPELIYRTGDLVRYNEYGELIYISRKDFQIKHMGQRIELGEIETAVSSLGGISMCCCLYDENKQRIVLFIEEELDKTYINQKLSQIIPEYMLPNKVIKLEKLPINANGKIDRLLLKSMLL